MPISSPDMNRPSSFWSAVEQVLREADTPLHVKDITQSIEDRGLWRSSGNTPIATVTARLAREVKLNGDASRFRRASARNTFELNPTAVEASLPEVGESQKPDVPVETNTARPVRDARRRLSFTDAAEAVLSRFGNREPMHYRDITKLILAEQLVQTKGKTPEATLYARIIDEIASAKKHDREPRFVRHGKGLVSLTPWLTADSSSKIAAAPPRAVAPKHAFVHPDEPDSPIEAVLHAARWITSGTHDVPSDQSVAVRNYRAGGRILDYALFANGRLLGLVETKRHPLPLEILEQQVRSLAEEVALRSSGETASSLEFIYLVNGPEMFFLRRHSDSPRREVAGFHRPETLLRLVEEPPISTQVTQMPPPGFDQLRVHQADALRALEASLASGDRRALLEIPSGAGALAIAVAESYRLLRHTGTRHILFLADRSAAAEQAKASFLNFETPEGRFGDLYQVRVADSPNFTLDAHVLIMTVQKLHPLMAERRSVTESGGKVRAVSEIAQQPPIDSFEFIWCFTARGLPASFSGQLLDHFDAPIVGFTSIPSREATAYFDGNVVMTIDAGTLWESGHLQRSAGDWIHSAPSGRELPTPAPFLLDFLQCYLKERRATQFVDPWVSHPMLAATILDVDAARSAMAFLPSASITHYAKETYPDPRIDWVQRDLLKVEAEELSVLGSPDLIVSFPPLGIQKGVAFLNTPDGRLAEFNDEDGYRLLLMTAMRLTPGGEAIFMVADSFLFRDEPTRARGLLSTLGLYVHAVVAVEQGVSDLAIPTNLIFIGRTRPETIFVGKLSTQVNTDQLVSHLKRRRRGAVPELGRLVEWESFSGYAQLAAKERAASLIADTGLGTVSLGEILAARVQSPPRSGQDFQASENVVYLSRFSSGPIHTSREQLTDKPGNYYQLVLDPEQALAEYVALILTTPAGRVLREALATSRTRAGISLKALMQLQLPLPELHIQREVNRTHGQIGGLRLELDGLERRLASDPRAVAQVTEALEGIGKRNPLTTFRETMPFPLASILWRYDADADVTVKVAHLHRFFEASAIYFTAVLLSAFLSDRELFEEERGDWLKQITSNSFRQSSFGTWTFFGRKLADSTRRRLEGDKADSERMRAAFAVDAQQFVAAVSSQELWQLLDEAREERNRSKGHGGILGKSEEEDIHVRLSNVLTRLGGILGEPMTEVRLIRPGAARLRGGVGHYERAELLQGPHTIFQQTELSAFPQMDADELYLAPAGSRAAPNVLHIVALVRLQTASRSAENACYFYSRLIDEHRAEFVSHHFEAQPQITIQDQALLQLLARLRKP